MPPLQAYAGAAVARRATTVLVVLLACQLMVIMDSTVVTVALPSLMRDLDFTASGLSWVQNGYLLTSGGLLLLGGRAGDVFGRRRVLMTGLIVFTLASLLGGLATSGGWLIAARAIQGIGGALISPSLLALLALTFPDGPARNRALGYYSAVSGTGLVIGLILGGLLAEISWRWVQYVNIPIGLTAIILGIRFLAEPPRHPARLDVVGAVVSTIGMSTLVYGIVHAASSSWTAPATVTALAIGALALAAFTIAESRTQQPLVPLGLFAQRERAGAYLNMLLIPATMFAVFFFLTQVLQELLGLSPLLAGLAFIPLALTQVLAARTAPQLLPRLGPQRVSAIGTVLILAGIVWLSQMNTTTTYAGLLGPMILFGAGVGLCFMPLNMIVVTDLPPEDTGSASGLLQALQRLGGSLGLSVLVTVYTSAAAGTTGTDALVRGASAAFTASIGFVLAGLAVVLLLIRPRRRS